MSRTIFIGVAVATCLSYGCTSIVGINAPQDPPDAGASAMPDAGVPTMPLGLSSFIGTWQNGTGKRVLTCPGGNTTITDTNAAFTITAGPPGDIVLTTGPCNFPLTVSGNVASVAAGQTCMLSFPAMSETDLFTYSAGTFTLDADGMTGAVHLDGNVVVNTPTLTNVKCEEVQDDRYMKAPL